MTRFMACISAAILVLMVASRAETQELKRTGDVLGSDRGKQVDSSKGAAFIDYDNDGTVDLFLGNGLTGHQGWGVAVGDIDNDGRLDLFVVDEASGHKLFRNRGDGTFEDITETPVIETIKIEGGKVEINGQSIKIEGGKVEIIRRLR